MGVWRPWRQGLGALALWILPPHSRGAVLPALSAGSGWQGRSQRGRCPRRARRAAVQGSEAPGSPSARGRQQRRAAATDAWPLGAACAHRRRRRHRGRPCLDGPLRPAPVLLPGLQQGGRRPRAGGRTHRPGPCGSQQGGCSRRGPGRWHFRAGRRRGWRAGSQRVWPCDELGGRARRRAPSEARRAPAAGVTRGRLPARPAGHM
mmetsp:Transcript_116188/g.353389  ORF Transcript_116188/g.353389 Transcript_116188/m.353389 type:complete len:205 (+) Transcript_116188:631-1245(+)